ncbi:endonuclease [uncultured Polaribacter sp.]|uniref:endonuclease n=1 Tax=uncultured Polaribacter sp. TaxID=174711 RepID=UPI0030D8E64B|tara:strand:- start:4351 stop:6540 length:2190 start_codon:yes stop_codon:yes gene_type:complete
MIKKLLLLIVMTVYAVSFSQETYYNDVNLTLSGAQLKAALATKIIATHTNMLTYTPGVWEATKITDANPANTSEVILIYGWENGTDQDITNDRTRDNSLQDRGTGESFVWNREHVFSKSLANPILIGEGSSQGPGSDAHNLRAADRTRNSERNNFKLAPGSGNSSRSNVTYSGPDGPNTRGWYPGDEWKGDAARMIMYMYLRYGSQCLPTNVGVGSNEFTSDEMIDLFLQWNIEDPVSAIEIARNTYHENTSNTYAQGNRNPFIDNPYLATRIWGGNSAEDRWNYYTSTDTQAPTTPANVTLNNITLNSITVSWSASSDNIGVTGYNVYIDGILKAQTPNTSITFSNLTTNTAYSFTVVAKDLINNMSSASASISGTTLQDANAPTTPTNLVFSNQTDSSFKVSWTASTDNNAVTGYEVYVNNNLAGTATDVFYTVTGLTTSTTYAVQVLAFDADANKSDKSTSANVTTTAGTSNGVTELFISEYVEPSTQEGGNNKAIEIVNLTASTINLSNYSIQKQSNGGSWGDDYPLGNGSIVPGDVFVIRHADADNSILLAETDLVGPPNIDTFPYGYGSPMNFNGNDPVGLFKNGVLIDIVGQEGNSSYNVQDETLRRKATISKPNTTFDRNEWDALSITFDGFGRHTSTLSTSDTGLNSFKMYPNPTNGNVVYFQSTDNLDVKVYNVVGKLILDSKINSSKNSINISTLSTGVYFVKVASGSNSVIKKLIKN